MFSISNCNSASASVLASVSAAIAWFNVVSTSVRSLISCSSLVEISESACSLSEISCSILASSVASPCSLSEISCSILASSVASPCSLSAISWVSFLFRVPTSTHISDTFRLARVACHVCLPTFCVNSATSLTYWFL